MTRKKTSVLVLFGGRSPEHDVSVITGLQVVNALDPDQFEAIPLYIAPDGSWLIGDMLRKRENYIPSQDAMNELTHVVPYVGKKGRPALITRPTKWWQRAEIIEYDLALLSFHGLVGEDGPLQGLFDTANVPFTGMRLMASSVLMNKTATKRILSGTGVPMLPFWEIHRPAHGMMLTPSEVADTLGNVPFPCCIKPANLGSSIGVSRVGDCQDVSDVLPGIFRFDETVMLEPFVENLVEYNVAVCRVNGEIRTSAIERPKRSSELLDFKTKYMAGGSKDGSKMGGTKVPGQSSEGMLSLTRDINPNIPHSMEQNIRNWAIEVFEHVGGTGAPRLDFLCNDVTGEVWFNEANPCPGSFGYFLWEAAPKPMLFPELLDVLMTEAFDLHARKQIPMDPTPEEARLFPRK